MMILLRYFLIGLIIYLIVRAFVRFGDGDGPSSPKGGEGKGGKPSSKKVSKAIGEYVDYEEVKKK